MIVVYGIKNCDTVKKALRWRERYSTEYRFHDFRQQGLSRVKVQSWLECTDIEK